MVSRLAVCLAEGHIQPEGGGAVLAGLEEAWLLGGWLGALTLLLGQLRLHLREREEHTALDLSDLNTWPTGGTAG